MRYFFIFLLILSRPTFAQKEVRPQQIARQIKKVFGEKHLQPRLIDDSFSRDVFDQFLIAIDPDKLYFTKDEIIQLTRFRELIDDQINLDRWDFLPFAQELFRQSLERSQHLITSSCKSNVPFTLNEELNSREGYAQTAELLAKQWNQKLQYEIMEDIAQAALVEKIENETAFFGKHEPVSREKVCKTNLRLVSRVLKHSSGFENHLADLFLKTCAAVYDPHSVYLSPTQMESFIRSLSTEGYYFGLDFEENERGELTVTAMLPGGPAWNSGAIKNGDVLQKVRWAGQEWREVTGISTDDLEELLSSQLNASMEFHFLRQGISGITVELRKEKVNHEAASVRSFILQGKNKVGYISLPDFYSNWDDKDQGGRSASDVAKEIVKLKKDNIEGLILDLRFNGGGSLAEAVAMAGIFIDGGAVAIERGRGTPPVTLKDINRGTVYDGPLVILVNGASASASEVLAAVLQDYNRALIVGSTTFGKGIGQQVFSLDPRSSVVDFNAMKGTAWGFATITTIQIYRIDGKSVQGRGVKPDIGLPDPLAAFITREDKTPFAIRADSIQKKTYAQVLPPMNLQNVSDRSLERINANTPLRNAQLYTDTLAKSIQQRSHRLQWNEIRRSVLSRANYSVDMLNARATVRSYDVHIPAFALERMKLDSYVENINKGWVRNLSHDHTLEETFLIICDYIDSLKQP